MPAAGAVGSPEKLSADHDLTAFVSGEPELDDWLRRRARQDVGWRAAGYYTPAVGAVAHAEAPGPIRRNMPEPVPPWSLAVSQLTKLIKARVAEVPSRAKAFPAPRWPRPKVPM
jgi:hypothetical protein